MRRGGVLQVVRISVKFGLGLAMCFALVGCLVAGYSSGSGWWVWPGSFVLTLVLVLMWLLTRR